MKKTVRKAVAVGLHLLPLATPLAAQDVLTMSLESLARLPVTAASGYARPQTEVSAASAVVRAAQWEALGADNVYEVLQYVPGLHVVETGKVEKHVVARGLHTFNNAQVLWLLDGQPLNEMSANGPPAAFNKGLAGLDRIEVIFGPVSVIHGSNALSAVINLISREAGMPGHRVGMAGGNFGARQALAETGSSAGDWRWRVNAETRRSTGDPGRNIARDQQSELFDPLFGTQASQAPGALPSAHDIEEAELNLGWKNSALQAWHWRNEADGGVRTSLDPEGRMRGEIDHVALRQEGELAGSTRWQLEGLYQRQEARLDSFVPPPGAVVPIGSDGNFDFASGNPVSFPDGVVVRVRYGSERRRLALNFVNRALEKHTLRLGLGQERQELRVPEDARNFGPGVLDGTETSVPGAPLTDLAGTPFSFFTPGSRHVRFIALQDDWRLHDKLQLSLGVRHDDYSDFGSSTNPRLNLHWQARPATALRLGAGRAFRAPSFSELGLRNNPAQLGNPGLAPETMRSVDFGLEQRFAANLQLDATVFHYKVRDLIDFAPQAPANAVVAQNLGDREGEGGTLALRWQPQRGTQLNASATLWDVHDTTTNARVAQVPQVMAGVSGWWEFAPGWTLGGIAKHIGGRERAPADPRADPGDDSWADLHLHTTRVAPGLKLGLTVKNLADADLRDPLPGSATGSNVPDDLPLAGRSWHVEAEYRWGGRSAAASATPETPRLP